MRKIKVRDLAAGYRDEQDLGVVAFGGRLNVRPPYQREFVYKGDQREAVLQSVRRGFPINVMYWSKSAGDDAYEVLDGQQRTISICQFVEGDYSIVKDQSTRDTLFFKNFTQDEKTAILDYDLDVYVCEGTDREKLDWFRIINIAGEKLTDQELRNAVYPGPWLTDAKKYFSRRGGDAWKLSSNVVTGKPIRQELLEKALRWISKGKIEDYMAEHQHDLTANPLRFYFQSVIHWVDATFPVKREAMRSVDWGPLYDAYHDAPLVPGELEARIDALMKDDEVDRKSGIYPYVLDGDERHLNLRTFSDSVKQTVYAQQNGICPACSNEFGYHEMEGDHIDPWHSGGKTTVENCQMLCKPCNRRKSGK
ncbi:TPA: DUF262 domain-containing protein [Burkholderia vietnamiensis]|nr:DUF262 domain-containing protein [Burkholderia vietnamiensis]